jgi:hypothetical protein
MVITLASFVMITMVTNFTLVTMVTFLIFNIMGASVTMLTLANRRFETQPPSWGGALLWCRSGQVRFGMVVWLGQFRLSWIQLDKVKLG